MMYQYRFHKLEGISFRNRYGGACCFWGLRSLLSYSCTSSDPSSSTLHVSSHHPQPPRASNSSSTQPLLHPSSLFRAVPQPPGSSFLAVFLPLNWIKMAQNPLRETADMYQQRSRSSRDPGPPHSHWWLDGGACRRNPRPKVDFKFGPGGQTRQQL